MKRAKFVEQPAPDGAPPELSFTEELRSVVRPAKKWHYLFHVVVILVALSYWVGSLLELPEASWAEIVMYRPKGDNQVYPVVTALSRLNFGDPTDAVHYGKGVAGFHAVILLPHALAVSILGGPGYMVADAFFFWAYFVAINLLLRRCQIGVLPSLIAGSALATGSLQSLASKASIALLKLVVTFDAALSEWSFPNLVNLQIFDTRIPRPLITEILVVLILYCFLKEWRRIELLDAKAGVFLGILLGLLVQGDPYSFSVLGLVLLAVVARNMTANHWTFPWRFTASLGASGLVVGSYFLFQLAGQDADASVRFGLANFPRSRLLPLPGYAPVLRVAVVALLAGIVLFATRKLRPTREEVPGGGSKPVGRPHPSAPEDSARTLGSAGPLAVTTRRLAQFCLVLIGAAWLAQPVQVFLLGKGAQLYHYLSVTLPCFYSYAMVLLLARVVMHAVQRFAGAPAAPGSALPSPAWARRILLAGLFTGEILLGVEAPLDAIKTPLTAREEIAPWAQVGARYRASFRALDAAFSQEPTLKEARTFATFNYELNFLLAGFHNKRAYLPDNGFTTLPDRELERRLFEVAKICQLRPDDQFPSFIQNHVVLNYWLGCAKYWFASDHSYAPLAAYSAAQLEGLKKLDRQAPFSLALPPSELERLRSEYAALTFQESDVSTYPDLIIITVLLKGQGVVPHPALYAEVYKNDVFWVYRKMKADGVYSAGPATPTP